MAADPDPQEDLEYRMIDLDLYSVEDSDSVVLLPNEADMLRENAFLVTDERHVCDLADWA